MRNNKHPVPDDSFRSWLKASAGGRVAGPPAGLVLLSVHWRTWYLGIFALLCQAAGQELMLTAPLTRAALLKLTGRPSIIKWRMQPVKGLPGARCGVSRDSEERKQSKMAIEAFQAQILLHGKNCSHQDDLHVKNEIQLFTNILRNIVCFWSNMNMW